MPKEMQEQKQQMMMLFSQLGIDDKTVEALISDFISGKIKDQNELMMKVMQI
jgi:hypothetical protein